MEQVLKPITMDILPVSVPISAEVQVLAICPHAILQIEVSREKTRTYTVMNNGSAMAASSFDKDKAWEYALKRIKTAFDQATEPQEP